MSGLSWWRKPARPFRARTCAGLPKFSIEEGSIGADARAMGAASLSLFANYIIDRDVLFKEAF